jgi:hypothetical protein
MPADWNYTAFIEPCLAAVPIPFRPPRTGPAAAAIICSVLILGLLGTYLWWVIVHSMIDTCLLIDECLDR